MLPSPTELNFIHFGSEVGDSCLPNVDDDVDNEHLGPYDLDIPIVFYRSAETRVFVSDI